MAACIGNTAHRWLPGALLVYTSACGGRVSHDSPWTQSFGGTITSAGSAALASGGTTSAVGGAMGGVGGRPAGRGGAEMTGGSRATGGMSVGGATLAGGAPAAGGTGGIQFVGSPCVLAADPGPCTGHFSWYFFNVVTGRCETFVYGGCEGNGNRYETLAECERACPTPPSCSPRMPSSWPPWSCVSGWVCYYVTGNSCRCVPDGLGGCNLVDLDCPASSSTSGGAGGGGSEAPTTRTLVCSCGSPAWVCAPAAGLP